ncbi:hypothetical protein AB1Y20_002862 [Prymnesium parvum]|uniref:EF-hand domain-containing protein n=1 Tax=Prymnesium parvum TaxID=97485 RepID=A0AB34JD04_PRYPA|mmetsp:Transcript_14431/g.32695  ORF Transcript_14431/g.32695 Transcript_14431/m.32695 type:complete len:153 (+) Transcript_14431:70-528(+)
MMVETDDGFREAFNMFDQDNDGFVSQKELKKVMATFGDPLTDEEVQDIMRESNSDGKLISYSAFCKLMGSGFKASVKYDPEEDIKHAFSLFDLDRDGFISPQEMMTALGGLGVPLSAKEVDQLMGEATMTSSRRVSYEVFKQVTQNGFASAS